MSKKMAEVIQKYLQDPKFKAIIDRLRLLDRCRASIKVRSMKCTVRNIQKVSVKEDEIVAAFQDFEALGAGKYDANLEKIFWSCRQNKFAESIYKGCSTPDLTPRSWLNPFQTWNYIQSRITKYWYRFRPGPPKTGQHHHLMPAPTQVKPNPPNPIQA